ncbi:hypothetical protein [Catenuloplanes indicus]|uniref:Transmembrane protein n=1 Tax=Catenuloplanes indicus TaxID=137267 RepID=A0AAE3W069_9ACTN|nr:hypothetical protein [Catenuloplanes indicus]MDQ0366905.1 hypothetical protein [Catenuloplanes indicus]
MSGMTSGEAAEALQVVGRGVRTGAAVVGPRSPTRYVLITGLLAAALGACFDIPASLWGVGAILRFPLPLVVCAVWTVYTRWEWLARPRWAGYGSAVVVALIVLHVAVFAVAGVVGMALRDAGVPVPFAIAGLIYAVLMMTIVGFAARRLAGRYADRLAREPR